MLRICFGVLLVFVAVSAAVNADDTPPVTPGPPSQPTTSTTTEKPTTSSTTTPKPTTSSTTTPKPTTSSTTTPKPTTSSTTTAKPTTSTTSTTTPKPTPTPTPAPTPTPSTDGVWNVTETVNKTVTACIVAKMNIEISIRYVKVDPKNTTIHSNWTKVLFVPKNAVASGTCGSNTSHQQSLTLTWKESNTPVSIEFGFTQNKTTGFTLSSVNLTILATTDVFPDIEANHTFTLVSHNTSLPPTPANQSFKCYTGVPLTLVDVTPAKNATPTVAALNMTMVQIEAFAHTTGNKFGAVFECAGDEYITPDIVPIAVGVALAALVAVVLVAYVIGRRRSNASGYLSM